MKWLEVYGGMEVLSLLFRLPRVYIFDELRATIGQELGWTIILSPVRRENALRAGSAAVEARRRAGERSRKGEGVRRFTERERSRGAHRLDPNR